MEKLLTYKDLKPGDRVKVLMINALDNRTIRKLAVFGLMPGTEIEVLQIKPAYVFRMGNTELALDSDIARNLKYLNES